MALAAYLEDRGWAVQIATSTRGEIWRWSAGSPRLVVTDLGSHDVDGYELLRVLAALAPRPRLVVRVPSRVPARLERALGELGADVLLPYPCRLDDVVAVLAGLILEEPPAEERLDGFWSSGGRGFGWAQVPGADPGALLAPA
jgi:DNA-binding response OmpR family regulator